MEPIFYLASMALAAWRVNYTVTKDLVAKDYADFPSLSAVKNISDISKNNWALMREICVRQLLFETRQNAINSAFLNTCLLLVLAVMVILLGTFLPSFPIDWPKNFNAISFGENISRIGAYGIPVFGWLRYEFIVFGLIRSSKKIKTMCLTL